MGNFSDIIYIAGVFVLGFAVSFIYLQYYIRRYRRRQKAKFNNLMSSMPIAYVEMKMVRNKRGKIVDFIIKTTSDSSHNIFSDGRLRVGELGSSFVPTTRFPLLIKKLERLQTTHTAFTEEYTHAPNDKMYSAVVSPSQKHDYVGIYFIENTELLQAKDELHLLTHKLEIALESSNSIPWMWRLDANIITYRFRNNAPLRLNFNEYMQRVHPEEREQLLVDIEKYLLQRKGKFRTEFRVNLSGAIPVEYDWVVVHAMVDSVDSNGNPMTIIGSTNIRTERKKIEIELRAAQIRAEESTRQKSAFLANMSHEIRTPLNAIVGFSNLIATTDDAKEKRQYATIISNNTRTLLKLIGDILDMSKVEAGTLEFAYSTVDFNALIREAVQMSQLQLQTPEVSVVVGTHEEECTIYTERNRVMQVITNLVSNAIKFTTKGTIEVGYRIDHKLRTIYVYVKDTGCGIPKDKTEKVFDRFVQLNSQAQGTGLGLSICRTIIKYMNGDIGVTSELGVGSTFWFTLPYQTINNE